jgi:hypothetical protein
MLSRLHGCCTTVIEALTAVRQYLVEWLVKTWASETQPEVEACRRPPEALLALLIEIWPSIPCFRAASEPATPGGSTKSAKTTWPYAIVANSTAITRTTFQQQDTIESMLAVVAMLLIICYCVHDLYTSVGCDEQPSLYQMNLMYTPMHHSSTRRLLLSSIHTSRFVNIAAKCVVARSAAAFTFSANVRLRPVATTAPTCAYSSQRLGSCSDSAVPCFDTRLSCCSKFHSRQQFWHILMLNPRQVKVVQLAAAAEAADPRRSSRSPSTANRAFSTSC